jgi:hypothetical protein
VLVLTVSRAQLGTAQFLQRDYKGALEAYAKVLATRLLLFCFFCCRDLRCFFRPRPFCNCSPAHHSTLTWSRMRCICVHTTTTRSDAFANKLLLVGMSGEA